MPSLLGICNLAAINSNDPLAAFGGTQGLDALATGGTLIGLAVSVMFFIWLAALGILLPWFVWRTKVYAKRQYLLSKRMFELMRQQAMRATSQGDAEGGRRSHAA